MLHSLLYSCMLPLCLCKGFLFGSCSALVIFKLFQARFFFLIKQQNLVQTSIYIKHLKAELLWLKARKCSQWPFIPSYSLWGTSKLCRMSLKKPYPRLWSLSKLWAYCHLQILAWQSATMCIPSRMSRSAWVPLPALSPVQHTVLSFLCWVDK